MGSWFDALRNLSFDTTKGVFGYQASWVSRDAQASYSGLVHFKNPTEEVQAIGIEYNVDDWMMEYKEGDFPGLFSRAEQRLSPPEFVTIDGADYYVKEVIKVHDGATYRASLIPRKDGEL